jgi:hypothetical protein
MLIGEAANTNFIVWFDPTLARTQGSPHLQKTGRLDFALREHEGEVKA